MSREFDVMAAGHLCLDMIPRLPETGAATIADIMRPGTLVQVGECGIGTGGPVSNTGIAMKRLGGRVSFSARVGDDDFGRLTVEYIRTNGNAEGVRVVPGGVSSYTVVIAPPGIDRMFLHNPASNDLYCADDIDPDLVARCRHFHFGYPPLMRRMFENEGRELEKIFRIAKDAGASTSCDMALPDPDSEAGRAPWAAILERVLPHVDVFLPSAEEAFFMLERDAFLAMKAEHAGADLIDVLAPEDYSRLAEKLLGLGTKMVSLKSGHRGIYFRTGSKQALAGMGGGFPGDPDNWAGRELWCPAFEPPKIASAAGSGDSAIAGFLTAFLKGLPIEKAMKCAVCLGWQNLRELDAVSGIGTWDETLSLLARDMPVIDARVSSPGWKWSDRFKLWSGPNDEAGG